MTDRQKYRLLEAIPGTLTWFTFTLAILLSVVKPLWAIALVILFDLYWLLRVGYFVFYLIHSWRIQRRESRRAWWDELRVTYPSWGEYYHIIFLPTYRESKEVIETTLTRFTEIAYDPKRLIVVLAGEERDAENFSALARELEARYASHFHAFITTLHPKDLPNEIPGKGANLNWSGHRVQEYVDEQKLAYDKLIVSAFDVDTIVAPQYFACLTYTYLSQPNPQRSSYQPAVVYNNNLWESPALVRIAAMGTTFWLMTELARPERLFTFSSHSMSWQALVDVGFWEKRIVTEDSRIFLQCFLHYEGDYVVTPMYVPVSMDMVAAGGYVKSLGALYRQQRRWAWGVEHLPFMLWNFRKHPNIPMRKKLYYLWNLGEGMYTWATAPILITVLGYLPLYLAPLNIAEVALTQNAPALLELLLRLAMVGIFVSGILGMSLLPPRPNTVPANRYLIMILQWALLPFTLILFGSLPAIDAQTRLLLGKHLGFNVTHKVRKSS
ncbi:MAG: glycosyltransferase family 2 protein [Patescibacteria group bacterium]|jgi:cellulose synthase/poly-beta-1,6-N-acetylglucosamine synthase-like glycosyltransferase